ncbi:MAG: hypothetical protein LQ343_004297 [Gyalolechia ehrenbergii]|nr:MAG: hypothetical protein LQ343_004297 [Gyalolechia ehrenbergii]
MASGFLKHHGIDLQEEISKVQFSDTSASEPLGSKGHGKPDKPLARNRTSHQHLKEIKGVILPGRAPDSRWDVFLEGETIASIKPYEPHTVLQKIDHPITDYRDAFLAPSLCHPHIHLDKCFLLSDPKYADLSIEKGDFTEALSLTSQAKTRFTDDDLERRGRWLIEESIAAGVTCMRAFVEVDTTVRFKCLDAGLKLKEQYRGACEIQICTFAQDPVFSGDNAAEGRNLMEEALRREGVDVVGSTPYVEADEDLMRKNIDWAVDTAMQHGKHLDLHLDYNLDEATAPKVYYVIDALRKRQWKRENRDKKIVLGHCTRLTLLTREQWLDLRARIDDLPISFVGLPTSDLFMMGKPFQGKGGGERVRGTLQIPQMIQQYGIEGAISVNNVGNAFTPQGSCDPLSIASLGVGVYQAGTKRDAEILYECISVRAKEAIGCEDCTAVAIANGQIANFVVFLPEEYSGGRGRGTLQELVYNPPGRRHIFRKGLLVEV